MVGEFWGEGVRVYRASNWARLQSSNVELASRPGASSSARSYTNDFNTGCLTILRTLLHVPAIIHQLIWPHRMVSDFFYPQPGMYVSMYLLSRSCPRF
jgi:hypothetical protein